jgi:signal transduction histidine kinase
VRGLQIALALALATCAFAARAQLASPFDEAGRFYVRNFGPEDYDAHAQNWAIVESPEGLLYVGNNDGVLEYDGVSWRLIPVANHSVVRSLAVDADGRIVVGATDELGYLAPDELGRTRYVSLLDHVPPDDRAFAAVWHVVATSGEVYFQCLNRLFRWDGREMKVWRSETDFVYSFAAEETLYVLQDPAGWMRVDGDSLAEVPGDETFHRRLVTAVAPLDEAPQDGAPQDRTSHLFVSEEGEVFRCAIGGPAGASCTAFSPGADDLLAAFETYRATTLPGGILAVGTVRGGLVLLDRDGRLLRVLDEASGLRDQSVTYPYLDRRGGLWLCLNNGLARVEIGAALSYYDKTMGLRGSVLAVARHRGRLYAATSLGVFRLQPAAGGTEPRFTALAAPTVRCWTLLPTPQGLLATCRDGVYDIDAGERIATFGAPVLAVSRSGRDPALLYLGLAGGLARLRLQDGRWADAGTVDGVHESVHSIAEDADGNLWLGTRNEGVLKVEPAAEDPEAAGPPVVTRFGAEHGLPLGQIRTQTVAGRVVLFSPAGVFRPADGAGGGVRLVPDPAFDGFQPARSRRAFSLDEDDRGRVWIGAGEASAVGIPRPDGTYAWQSTALRQVPVTDVYVVRSEAAGATWVGGPHGLIRLDPVRALEPPAGFPVWIRRITTAADSLLYDGRRDPAVAAPGDPGAATWPYRDNVLRFVFAAPRYAAAEGTWYRTRLDGLDDDWSPWSRETLKDYNNLWEGWYVFRVQARDVAGSLSQEDGFAFRILPPWYRTWWAYGLYAVALLAAILAWVRSHRRELEQERRISHRLREVDKLKDEFLANTSHELRTPLYGITGLAESLIDGATGELPEATKANLGMLVASARRLTALIDDILDFSKLEHDSLEVDLKPVDLHSVVDLVLALSRPLVGAKPLELNNAVAADLPAVLADENRLQQILHNLVGNAIKFTEAGEVEVAAAERDGRVLVRVRDTGIGIPEGQQERIFEAFAQADASIERQFGGTGLGLAVSRRLIDLHGGSLGVESAPGKGATFFFDLEVCRRPAAVAVRPRAVRAPVFAAAPPPALEPADEARIASAGGARLMVVDDEPVIRQVVTNQLTAHGYRVTAAAGGEEALRLLEEHSVDLVILDVMMPRLSGFEVCRRLRQRHSLDELPVIFLTARSRAEDLVVGMAAGANDYLPKPVSKSELLARVQTHLALLSVNRQLAGLVAERTSQLAERERLLFERERLIGQLEARNAELARFNYSVTHDLRNPLTTIRNFIGVLEQDVAAGDESRLHHDLRHIDQAAAKLHLLLEDLQEYSKVEQVAMPCEEVEVAGLVGHVLAELAPVIDDRGIAVEVAADLPEVCGDRARLLVAVRHLLVNAFQHMGDQPQPRVEVGVRRDPAENVFFVRDNGKGIDPKFHDKVFGLFERLEPEASEGTGVGLALVKRVVEVHGGRIWVESKGRGRGTAFCWTLPVNPPPTAPPPRSPRR